MAEVKIEERSPEKIKPKFGSAFAAWVNTPYGSMDLGHKGELLLTGATNEPDKMQLPSDFQERLSLVRYYYEVDPIANTAIDKIVDIGINELNMERDDCSDEEFEVYQAAIRVYEDYLKDAALEYLLSGLIVPQVSWRKYTPAELGIETGKQYSLPNEIWLVDPGLLSLNFKPFSTDVEVWMHIPDDIRKFIASGGKRADGSKDQETYDKLTKEFPEFVRAIKNGKTQVLLEDAYVIRRRPKVFDPYPTPYLLSALESLTFKRNLKKMDYAIASRVIGAIQLIKLGNDEYPLTEDDEDQLDDLKDQMLWRSKPKNIDRVFQLFANHTLEIQWIYPDTEAMLNESKYEAVNQDIFNALGIPRILVSGETLRSATSQAEFAMFSPAETINRVREHILEFIEDLVDEIKERNKFENKVNIYFEELRLYDLEKLAQVAVQLYQNNAISLTSLAGIAGYNFEDELEKKSNERELMKEFGVPEFPALPFSPQPQVPGQGQPQQQEVEE
jgi:predicted HTH domain antitoxin